jgi:hypothetical protein
MEEFNHGGHRGHGGGREEERKMMKNHFSSLFSYSSSV